MSFNATWSMAVGGMVGGGIFSVLGVIISIAGQWAWLSFVLAGLIALISVHSYSQLSLKYQKSGGAFTFLSEINHKGFAGSLSWILIIGYILTMSVYAFTFGHYVAELKKRIKNEEDQQEELRLKGKLARVEETEVCVVVSSEQNEVDKFRKMNLEIAPHREKNS